MQAESRIAVGFPIEDSVESYNFPETQNYDYLKQASPTFDQFTDVSDDAESSKSVQQTAEKPRESKLDLVSASFVYGLTAMFMAFMFGYVTEYMPFLYNISLSVLMGLCIGVIAFALMRGDD